jgi:hypothetical protein
LSEGVGVRLLDHVGRGGLEELLVLVRDIVLLVAALTLLRLPEQSVQRCQFAARPGLPLRGSHSCLLLLR